MEKRSVLAMIFVVLALLLLIVMVVQLFPLLRNILYEKEDASNLVAYIQSIGWRGVPALIALSALQVVLPIIPAPVVGVLTGLSYGIYWGPLIILSGIALGNLFVFVSVRQLSGLILANMKPREKKNKYLSIERLEKIKRPEIVAFFLIMIPFLSGVGPYLFAETKVSLGKYIIAVVLGCIPFTLVYVFLGDRISRGSYTVAIITAALVVIALVFVLVFRKKIMEKIMEEGDL